MLTEKASDEPIDMRLASVVDAIYFHDFVTFLNYCAVFGNFFWNIGVLIGYNYTHIL